MRLYSLREDERELETLRQAAARGAGFEPMVFEVGSPEFWLAVDRGEIKRRVFEGTLTSVHWGPMGDTPGFEITDADGTSVRSLRRGDPTRYVEGLRARVVFLVLRAREPRFENSGLLVLSIDIESSSRRTERSGPGPHGVLERKSTRALEVTSP